MTPLYALRQSPHVLRALLGARQELSFHRFHIRVSKIQSKEPGKPPARFTCQPLPNLACGLTLPPAFSAIALAPPKTISIIQNIAKFKQLSNAFLVSVSDL